MGLTTFEVPLDLFVRNRHRLCHKLQASCPDNAFVVLQGGVDVPFNDTDINYLFRQESYFMWAFGITVPGCYGCINVKTCKSTLFIPKNDSESCYWLGALPTLNDIKKKYGVEEAFYVDDIAEVLGKSSPSRLLTMKGTNSDSGLTTAKIDFKGIDQFKVDDTILYNAISLLRMIKTDKELEVMKYVTEISSAAHRQIMKTIKPGAFEYQLESKFLNYCYKKGGCRFVSYTCICGSGSNSGILHYGHSALPNAKEIKDGDMCLFDMGANYYGYAADITCSFPVNGKFTNDQKLIYYAVLTANQAVFDACKPGINWLDMHNLAHKKILEGLQNAGIIQGSIDEMMEVGLGGIFMPHGLGHLIGLDVHDVGGYLKDAPERPKAFHQRALRMARILEEGMCLTIEPGCYFIDVLLNKALKDDKLSKYFVVSVLERFRGTGGVRIEDDVYITKTGCFNMTKVPRTIEEIEDWMAGKGDDRRYA